MAKPPIIIPIASGSGPIVYDAYDKWSGIALKAFKTAQDLANQLTNLPIKPVAFNASFAPQLALAPFPTTPKPLVPADLTYHAPTLPPAPPTFVVPALPNMDYVSALLDGVKTALGTMLGGNAMPPSLAAAIRERAYSAVFAEEQRAVDNAYSEFAARGFEEPSGALNRRITEARADAVAKRSAVIRDVFIQEQTVAIENLRFAVTAGLQLEATNVTVFRTKADVALESVRIESEQQRLAMEVWRGKVEMFDTQLRAEIARVDTTLKAFEAAVEVYRADAQIATAAGEYDNRRFQLNLAQQQAIVETEMKRADQDFEQLKYLTSVMLEIKKTLAAVSTQLAAAAMSAVNIGASMTSNTSQSVGYGIDLKYEGTIDDPL
jgi:hypothetical protein